MRDLLLAPKHRLAIDYLVAYLDRAHVSFAALKMNLDLGFSDRVYGLGVAMFFVGYILCEVPGAIIVERCSAREHLHNATLTARGLAH